MAFRPESRSSLILALSALVCSCSVQASKTDGRSQPPGAGGTAGAGAPISAGGDAEPEAGGGTLTTDGGASQAVGGADGAAAGAAQSVPGAGGTGMNSSVPFVYVGSTNGQISIFTLDAALGKLTLVKSVAAGNYPSFLAFDPTFARLYAVNEPDAKVASFSVDPKTGDLTFLNRVDSGGAAPAFVSVDQSGK
ncbi:MAG TPA: beta-propeller fold lactonase family protein, partial [Polyangiaceae bacterium]